MKEWSQLPCLMFSSLVPVQTRTVVQQIKIKMAEMEKKILSVSQSAIDGKKAELEVSVTRQ